MLIMGAGRAPVKGSLHMPMFHDRREAGKRLAKRLEHLKAQDPIVLALPRGGVPVAAEVARRLEAPLDLVVARKIGAPGQPELAIGAVATCGDCGDALPVTALNRRVIAALGLREARVAELRDSKIQELRARVAAFRTGCPALKLAGRCVVLVDDGIATGATVEAALLALRQQKTARTVLAVPVSARDSLERLAPLADEAVCLWAPEDFYAVGQFYDVFDQVEDEEVRRLLDENRA